MEITETVAYEDSYGILFGNSRTVEEEKEDNIHTSCGSFDTTRFFHIHCIEFEVSYGYLFFYFMDTIVSQAFPYDKWWRTQWTADKKKQKMNLY